MPLIELFAIGLGVAMDAFAIAICLALSLQKPNYRQALVVALYFGVFQALIPLLGYLLGSQFALIISAFDHWVAFGVLTIIGMKMILESRKTHHDTCKPSTLSHKVMLPLAFATSIDALAVGISLAFLSVSIVQAIIIMGGLTFVIAFIGFRLGRVAGPKLQHQANFFGGIILIAMGIKILIEHLIT